VPTAGPGGEVDTQDGNFIGTGLPMMSSLTIKIGFFCWIILDGLVILGLDLSILTPRYETIDKGEYVLK